MRNIFQVLKFRPQIKRSVPCFKKQRARELSISEKKKNKGFTLIEILVMVGIILLLSAIVIPRYAFFKDRLSLSNSAFKLSQDLRRAQEMAISARKLGGSIPPGYGIYFRTNDETYLLYADTFPVSGNQEYDEGQDEIIEEVQLPNNIYIGSLSISPLSVNFKGPDPVTTISSGGEADISLSLENSSEKKEIKVNEAGLICVDQW